ncbi:DinB family protein [Pedobacter duraquae]|uniref:DinB family protein n=1 Tax=Pedobacter duraquae TaxID=425511 RepID=A0A4R6IM91_9SPHI|nr:DinB family protein [Pedobacter duraquae]TDO23280.1 DinB family protein [Pedobacter duraquae]
MKKELASQYRAVLKMLFDVIERCPDELWGNTSYENSFRRIAYHTLHFTALYLAESEGYFRPWHLHVPSYHSLGFQLPLPEHEFPGYTKQDLAAYNLKISEAVQQRIDKLDLSGPSGFEWLPMNKLELVLYSLRHIQHHTGQLVERLRQNGIKSIAWIDKGEPDNNFF